MELELIDLELENLMWDWPNGIEWIYNWQNGIDPMSAKSCLREVHFSKWISLTTLQWRRSVFHSLSVSLLQQRTPEFVLLLRVNVDKFAISRRQKIIDDDIDPFAESPELEVKDSWILLGMLLIPFLVLMIRYDLCSYKENFNHYTSLFIQSRETIYCWSLSLYSTKLLRVHNFHLWYIFWGKRWTNLYFITSSQMFKTWYFIYLTVVLIKPGT